MATAGFTNNYLPIRSPQFTADVDAQIEDNHEDHGTPPEQMAGASQIGSSAELQLREDAQQLRNEPGQQLQSIEDWERENPPSVNYDDPFVHHKAVPLPSVKTNGEHASQFNQFCQKYGLTSDFHIKEGPPFRYSAKVKYGDYSAEAPGLFTSKKEAKEAVCVLANRQNEKIEGTLTPYPKRKQIFDVGPAEAAAKRQRDSENWIGTLAEHSQKNVQPLPEYTEYQARAKHPQAKGLPSSGYQFACTVTLPGNSKVFGGAEALFDNKKEAKRNAAMEAVQYLRSTGVMSGTREFSAPQSDTAAPTPSSSEAGAIGPPSTESLPQKVVRLSGALGFTQPTYQKSAFGPNPSLVSMHAVYLPQDQQKEPKVAGKLGLVEGVYGQKAAKQQCAEKVAALLEGLQTERLAHAKEVWAGRKTVGY